MNPTLSPLLSITPHASYLTPPLLHVACCFTPQQLLKFASPLIGAAALPLTVLEQASELDCPWLVVMDR